MTLADRTARPALDAPSLSTLVRATAVALVVAGGLLVAIVLPAEYAIDPIGTGRWLGLTALASPPPAPLDVASPEGAALAPVQQGPVAHYPAEFKLDVVDVTLQPYEYVEYKYHLEEGATMLFSWTADAPVIHDMHGQRASRPAGGGAAEESFDTQNRRHANGSFTAPFTGLHGWFWENPGSSPIHIRLTSSGFYGSGVEIRSDHSRRTHDLRSLESLDTK